MGEEGVYVDVFYTYDTIYVYCLVQTITRNADLEG